jgi:hypothetical protein
VPESLATPDELELAVSGLAGILGAILLPTVAAWLRLLSQWLESGYAALGRNPRISGRGVLFALGSSALLLFVLFCLGRATTELRELRVEAPVVAQIVLGIIIGITLGGLYMVAWVSFRRGVARRRQLLR